MKSKIQNHKESNVKLYVLFEKSRLKDSKKPWSVSVYVNKETIKIGYYSTKEIADSIAEFVARHFKDFNSAENRELLRSKVREWAFKQKYISSAKKVQNPYAKPEKPVGTERINTRGFVEVKLAGRKSWGLKHHLIWEAAHGKLPENTTIRFKDGNRLNYALENLSIHRRRKRECKRECKRERRGEHRFTGRRRQQIKVGNEWVWRHQFVWEQKNGKLPENFIVVFKDFNPDNFDPDNLEILDKGEVGFRYWLRRYVNSYPDELKPAVETLALLRKEIRRRKAGKSENQTMMEVNQHA